PENRLRVYDVRAVIETLADRGSVLELRRQFGLGMVTALIRVEGRPLGLVANNPVHLAGAIDSAAADKAARFMQLCDAFDLPILFLCDTPGIMVGPEVEKTALVRHAARMFVIGASLSVPCFTIILRKGYGLGAQAMAAGSFKAPFFTVAWPTGEFGGMGLEGAVKLGYRNELAAVDDAAERKALFDKMVAKMYESGKALNVASHFEFDDVIDPLDSRKWIMTALRSAPPPAPRTGKKRTCIDTWYADRALHNGGLVRSSTPREGPGRGEAPRLPCARGRAKLGALNKPVEVAQCKAGKSATFGSPGSRNSSRYGRAP